MIPKIIHYCWLSSDPVPEDLQIYMKSWKEKLPDYEFIKWDFKNLIKNPRHGFQKHLIIKSTRLHVTISESMPYTTTAEFIWTWIWKC